jgi:AcrR family transcriptional regulator
MARPKIHSTSMLLDAARDLAVQGGVPAATVAAIAKATGASSGSIYHRFGSRGGVLIAAWQRAVTTFQDGFVLALAGPDPREAALAGARWVIEFSRRYGQDATLLATVRPDEVFAGRPPSARGDEAVARELKALTRRLTGNSSAAAVQRVQMAIIDFPYGVVRRYLAFGQRIPRALEPDVCVAVSALLDNLTKEPT